MHLTNYGAVTTLFSSLAAQGRKWIVILVLVKQLEDLVSSCYGSFHRLEDFNERRQNCFLNQLPNLLVSAIPA